MAASIFGRLKLPGSLGKMGDISLSSPFPSPQVKRLGRHWWEGRVAASGRPKAIDINCKVLTSKLSFSFVPASASWLQNYPPAQSGTNPTLGSRTHFPSQSRDQTTLGGSPIGSGREDGPLPQPCDFSRDKCLLPNAPSTLWGPQAPKPGPALLTKGNQICCSCSVRESSPRDQGSGWRKIPASLGV